jgi:hypothetical protein
MSNVAEMVDVDVPGLNVRKKTVHERKKVCYQSSVREVISIHPYHPEVPPVCRRNH